MMIAARAAYRRSRWPRGAWLTPASLIMMLAAILLAMMPRAAYAHAHLVKSAPAAGAHISTAPASVRLWFSEAADPAMTLVGIAGPNGVAVTVGRVIADGASPLLLTVAIQSPLPAGSYTVTWRTVAQDDGHPSHGSFTFTVDSGARTQSVTRASGAADKTAAHDTTQSEPAAGAPPAAATNTASVESLPYIFARWLNFLAIIIVIGVAAFRALVLPRAMRNMPGSDHGLAQRIRRACARLGLIAGIAAVVACVLRLYAEQKAIGDGVTPATLLQSFWGRMWQAQIVMAAFAVVVFTLACLSERESQRERQRGLGHWWWVAILAAIGMAITPALTSHAMAATHLRKVSVLLDVLHVIAAGGWVGGLLVMMVVAVPIVVLTGRVTSSAPQLASPSMQLAALANAFSPVALTFAGTVVVTGGIAAWLRVGSFSMLLSTNYGNVLLIKIGLVMAVAAAGAFNWLRMRAALSRADGHDTAVAVFRRSAWTEILLGLLVIAATAVLVAAQPPMH
ncbi:MAG: copper resistance protein CopC [Gemmatimonadaceae bacterium]